MDMNTWIKNKGVKWAVFQTTINLMHVFMKTLNWLYIHAQDDENKPRWKGDTFLVFWKATKFCLSTLYPWPNEIRNWTYTLELINVLFGDVILWIYLLFGASLYDVPRGEKNMVLACIILII
jgi:hypothetical protein